MAGNSMTSDYGLATPAVKKKEEEELEELDALIVGAGFAGVYLLHRLRQLGLKVKIFERGADLGGVWHQNCYPGARVDSNVPIYQFSLEECWTDWSWSERFPARDELLAYFRHVDKKLGISQHTRFNSCVVAATFDATHDYWVIRTDDGVVVRARFFLPCVGVASKWYVPDIPGLQTFAGECHHTAAWPQSGLDFIGKRVGVIGTGASGIQIIQEIGPHAAQLTVFQRTPNMALPMQQKAFDAAAQSQIKSSYADTFRRRQETFAGFDVDFISSGTIFEASPAEIHDLFEDLWQKGGFHFWLAGYVDILFHKDANDIAYKFWRDKVRARLSDPSMQEKLAPTTPPHAFGTKRPSLEQNYYEVFNQPNVELVDVRDDPIEEITPTGVKAKHAEYPLDVLIFATGFDAVVGGLTQIDIRGPDGISINERWATHGAFAHLGMAAAGYPNMFFPYGPQGPTAFCNGPTCAEIQGAWIAECIAHMRERELRRIEATAAAQEKWKEGVNEAWEKTLFAGTDSWFNGGNVPGKKKEPLNYSAGLPKYVQQLRESVEQGYEGFVLA